MSLNSLPTTRPCTDNSRFVLTLVNQLTHNGYGDVSHNGKGQGVNDLFLYRFKDDNKNKVLFY